MSSSSAGGIASGLPGTVVRLTYSANINRGSEACQKLFLKAIKEMTETKEIDIIQTNSQEFLEMITIDTKNFTSWDVLVHTIMDTDGFRCQISEYINKLSLEDIKKQAMKILFNNSATYAFDVTTDVVTTAIEPQSDPSHK